MAKKAGFSVIELTVVLAVILLLSALASAHLRKSKMAANRVAAVSSVRVINTAEATYAATYPGAGFANSLSALGNPEQGCEAASSAHACLIDPGLASGLKNGYLFDVTGDGNTPATGYTVTAVPQADNLSGDCAIQSDQSGQIRAYLPRRSDTARFQVTKDCAASF